MGFYADLGDLTLCVESYRLDGLVLPVKGGWDRHTTVVRLEGAGHVGLGEDVTYHVGDQQAFQRRGSNHPLAGDHTLESFSTLLDTLALFEQDPNDQASRDYRRWAFEAAALDLADVQALPFDDDSFDTVTATCVFCSVADPVAGLKEVARVATPGGQVLLLEHVRPRNPVLGWLADLVAPVVRRLMGPEINRRTEDNVTAAGLEIDEVTRWGVWREIVAHPVSPS